MTTPAVHDGLANNLALLFRSAAEAAAQRIRKLGWPLTVPVVKTSVKRDQRDPNAWETHEVEVQQNCLANRNIALYRLAPLLSEVIASVQQCASELLEAPGVNLPFWSVFEGNSWALTRGSSDPHPPNRDFTIDAIDWTVRSVILPALLSHLTDLPSLDSVTDAASSAFASDVLQTSKANDLVYRVTVPIAGLNLKGASSTVFTGDGVTLRRLNSDEQGTLLREWGIVPPTTTAFTTVPLVVLEIDVSTPRDRQNPDVSEDIARWLCAIQLHGYHLAGLAGRLETRPRWVAPISMGVPLTLSRWTNDWSSLSEAGFQKIRATVAKLKTYHITKPTSEHDLALHRFYSGAARTDAVDAVLDFVIALESLLLPYDENARLGDLGYRFRIHGAHYLAKAKRQRVDIAQQLSELYSLRSRLVHGGKYPAPAAVQAGRTGAEKLVRRGLLRAVSEGFPTATQLRGMVLGV